MNWDCGADLQYLSDESYMRILIWPDLLLNYIFYKLASSNEVNTVLQTGLLVHTRTIRQLGLCLTPESGVCLSGSEVLSPAEDQTGALWQLRKRELYF